ncbi:MAG TPA: FG-GAP-like repeat-containing protein, partial [Candidatus Brocadiia bacterium]|nr:FG-GAP-like repeat-containing protein [Candidatus Brocadiia bacterium]
MANQGSWLFRRFGGVACVFAALFAAGAIWFGESSRRVWPPWAWRDQVRVYPCEPAARVAVDGDVADWEMALWAPLVGANRRGMDGCVALRWDRDALYVAARARAGRVVSSADECRRGGCGLELELQGAPGLWIAPRFPRRQAALALVRRPGEGSAGFEFVDLASRAETTGWAVAFDAAGRPYLPAVDMHSGRGLGEGWGKARLSPNGVWQRPVVGRRAKLVLPVVGPQRMRLTLRGEPEGLADGVSQRVTVYLNGKRVAAAPDGEWRSRRSFDMELPAAAMVEGVNDVVLDFDREDGEPLRKGGRGVAVWMESVALAPAEGQAGPAPRLLAAGDVKGDGREEVCGLADGRLFAWSPAGAWAWAGGPKDLRPRCVAVGDLDNDGDTDIAALAENGETLHLLTPSEDAWQRLFMNTPAFDDKARPTAEAGRWLGMVIADVNNDDENELVALSDKEVTVLALRNGEWRGLQRLAAPDGSKWLFWADFDGDGKCELAVLSRPSGERLILRLWGPSPDGLAAWQGQLELGGKFDVAEAATGDLDGDGHAEIVLAAADGEGNRRLVSLTLRPQRMDDLGVAKDLAGWLAANVTGGALPGQRDGGGVAMAVLSRPAKAAVKDAKAPARKPSRRTRTKPGGEKPDFAPLDGSVTRAVRTAEGYDIEARVPWTVLKMAPPSSGAELKWRARLDPGGDSDGAAPKRPAVQQRQVVEFMARPLPAKRGPEMARYLPALTQVRTPPTPMTAGDAVTLEVFKGLAPGRAHPVEALALRGWNGGAAQAWREEMDDDLGCEVETWKARCDALADGGVMATAHAGWGATAFALGESRAQALAAALGAARRLESRLLRLAPKGPPAAATLLARVQAEAAALDRDPDRLAKAAPELAKIEKLLALMENGGGPALDKALQEPLRGYWCDIDGSVQPYAVSVPDSYTPKKAWPLVVCLHGAGYDPARRVGAPKRQDALALAPHGRGWTDYMGIGEADVFRVIDLARSQYNVDPNRISITGGSMGGTGSWQLATRRPDLFSALAPV